MSKIPDLPICKIFYRPTPLNILFYIVIFIFVVAYLITWIMYRLEPDKKKSENLLKISNIILVGGIISVLFIWTVNAIIGELSYRKQCKKFEIQLNNGIDKAKDFFSNVKSEIKNYPKNISRVATKAVARTIASQIDDLVGNM